MLPLNHEAPCHCYSSRYLAPSFPHSSHNYSELTRLAAVANSHAFRIPWLLGGQKPLSITKSDVDESGEHPFIEKLYEYFPIPDAYFEALSQASGQFDDILPNPEDPDESFDGDGEDDESSIEDPLSTFYDYWPDLDSDDLCSPTQPEESFGEVEYDSDSDSDDEVDEELALSTPPEGSIFGAAFDPPKWPTGIPRPKLPPKPKLPKRPHLPKKPHRPHPPKKPHWPHFPHHRPHHPEAHFKYINHTIFEFLANSSHHKILYKIIKNDSSLIDIFDAKGKGNITLFAPTDCAFKKILKHLPKDHPHPPKWIIKKLIEYHTLGSFHPAPRIFYHRTLPTLLTATHGPKLTQRIRLGHSLKGPAINFYVRPVFFNIFTKNGVVHAVDNILIPPPPVYLVLRIFPTAFSTFFQAFHTTHVANLFWPLKNSSSSWTVFAPTNIAWLRIPIPVMAWLFSPRGSRILTKLVEYHISPNHTFYTDSIWKPPHHKHDADNEAYWEEEFPHHSCKRHWKKQHFNTTLPTLIGGNATLRIDEFKFGPFLKIAINGRPGAVRGSDILGYDGCIQAVDRIVLPPRRKHHGRHGHHGHEVNELDEEWLEGFAEDDELTIENLKAIFGDDE